ncbi:MAG: hypothetical protein IJ299_01045 [Oscillospiraceae bacterium]|nr:hypothetical protein [Oscillospiraceae bacterium]
MDYKNSFVLYESVYAQYDRLMRRGKVQAAQDFIDAVMRYGLYGDEPDEDSEVWDYGFDGVIATISSAKDRYTKRIDIPQEELEQFVREGRTQQEMASYYGCSVDTIQRRMKQYGIARRKTAENTAKPQAAHRSEDLPQKSRKQFNENENENENVYENEEEKVKAKSRSTVGF